AEGQETVRRKGDDLCDHAVLDAKNIQRQGAPSGIAWPEDIGSNRWLKVGAGHNAAETAELLGAESAGDPQADHRITAFGHAWLRRHTEGRVCANEGFQCTKVRRFARLDVLLQEIALGAAGIGAGRPGRLGRW